MFCRPTLHWGVTGTVWFFLFSLNTHTHTHTCLLIHAHVHRHIMFHILFTNPSEINLRQNIIGTPRRHTLVLCVWLLEPGFFQLRHERYLHSLLMSLSWQWPQHFSRCSEGCSTSLHAPSNYDNNVSSKNKNTSLIQISHEPSLIQAKV